MAHCLMIGKEMKHRIKEVRMPSVRIKCTANMAHNHTTLQSDKALMKGPSHYMALGCKHAPFASRKVRKGKQKMHFHWSPCGKKNKTVLQPREDGAESNISVLSERSLRKPRGNFLPNPHILPRSCWLLEILLRMTTVLILVFNFIISVNPVRVMARSCNFFHVALKLKGRIWQK